MYGLETVEPTGRQQAELEMAGIKILRIVMSVTMIDGII